MTARSHSRTRKREKARRIRREGEVAVEPAPTYEALAHALVRRGLRTDVILDKRGIPNFNKPDRAPRLT